MKFKSVLPIVFVLAAIATPRGEIIEQILAALNAENLSMADLRRNLERSMIYQRVQQNEVLAKIGVTDDEAKKYYDSHLNEFTTSPTVTLREILVSVPGDR